MASTKSPKSATEPHYEINEVILAKLRGYPPWPAMVVDPESVPSDVKREKPPGKKMSFYCVRFFPAGDHAWAVAKDISRLQKHEIEAYINEPSKKNGELKKGYEIALNPQAWLDDLKNKREAAEAQAETYDQLEDSEDDGEGDEGGKKKKKKADGGQKRKRDTVSAEDKKNKRKSNSEAVNTKRRSTGGSKKKSKHASAEQIESEEDNKDEDAEGETVDIKPKKPRTISTSERPAKKQKKEKDEADEADDAALATDPDAQRVKEWRHKLQRMFLTPKTPPSAEDMPNADQIFQAVETFERLNIQYLSFSKIGKVMRRIAVLDDIPREAEFNFKQRAADLMSKWQNMLNDQKDSGSNDNGVSHPEVSMTEPSAQPSTSPVEKAAQPEANGTSIPPTNGITIDTSAPSDGGKADADGEVDADAMEIS